ncbi:hypothetical protein [Paenibacillus arenilitoris]|uniref:Translation initiation factor 2 n=1 Tax=Paenibacillus arenilitoris TaxID=2772299 RepID=A0A927CP96_9BACL|nr:hypothetical protein [Paenibacillus arenilitoris]MBD2869456.1 hypothetical protein [Paenibacillus arenilitoris]
MKRKSFKWAVLGAALAVIVVYGIDMTTAGIERINGPIEGGEFAEAPAPEPSAEAASGFTTEQQRKIAELERELEEVKRLASTGDDSSAPEPDATMAGGENERLPGIPLENDQSAVNKIADSTSGLLQSMSSEGIRLVVSIFDGLIK